MKKLVLATLAIVAFISCTKNEVLTHDPKLENVVSNTDSLLNSPTQLKDIIDGKWLTENNDTIWFSLGNTIDSINYPFVSNAPTHAYSYEQSANVFGYDDDFFDSGWWISLNTDTFRLTYYLFSFDYVSHIFKVESPNNNILSLSYKGCELHEPYAQPSDCNYPAGNFNRNEPNILTRIIE